MGTASLTDDRKKALGLAIAQIEKNHGKGSIMRMARVGRVRCGSHFRLARSTSTRRLASAEFREGRVTEIFGPESQR